MSAQRSAAESVTKIAAYTDQDRGSWDRFVERHPAGTFFHLSGWERVIRRALRHRTHYLVARAGEDVVGILPLVRVKSILFGDALISTPFCVYGGAIADDDGVRIALEDAAAELSRNLGVDYLEMRNRARARSDWPVKNLYFTFRRTLDADPEKNMLAIPRKQRAEVRAGIKQGLTVDFDGKLDRFYDIYSQSVRNLGTPVFGKRYFEILREEFGEQCEVTTIVHQQQPVSSLMTFWFRDEVLPYYGGGLPAARPLSAYDFMYWDLMRRACERGVRIYDFGRSKADSGPFRYKKHWGFEPEALNYEYVLGKRQELPNLSPTNPKYQLFVRAWQRMPLGLSQFVGPMISRYLG
jgi:FemAB-related protein (PEP-CTERM system-associated)